MKYHIVKSDTSSNFYLLSDGLFYVLRLISYSTTGIKEANLTAPFSQFAYFAYALTERRYCNPAISAFGYNLNFCLEW